MSRCGGAAAAVGLVSCLFAASGFATVPARPAEPPTQPAEQLAVVPRPRVVLLSTDSGDPLAGRIEAELHALGIEVLRAPIPAQTGIAEVVRALLGGGARAAVVAQGARTEVWIAERDSDRVALRQDLEVNETPGMGGVLALRTVEFLRVSLGLAVAPAAELPAPAPAASPSLLAGDWWAAEVSSGVLVGSGGLRPLVIAGGRVRAGRGALFGAELFVYGPVTTDQVSDVEAQGAPQGVSRTGVWMTGGGLLVAPAGDRLAFEAAVGAAAVVVRSTATALAPGTGGSDVQARLAAYARGGLRLPLGSRWALRADLSGGAMLRRVTLSNVTGTSDLASFGPVFAAGLLGAELRF